ncbi:MAG: hypothetical protein HY721_14590 [Planctomycetes bacterium]|nr:hypothetical protein [Planctomycetota bacterium]
MQTLEESLGFDPGCRPSVELARHVARALGWPYVELEEYSVSCGILRKVPAELACRLRCVPLVFNRRRVVLAVDDPFQGMYAQLHPELFGPPYDRDVEVALATARGIDRALEKRIAVVSG